MRKTRPYTCTASVRSTASCLRSAILSAFSLLLALLAAGCTDPGDEPAGTIAMEAWIDSDGYPVVVLSRALRASTTPTEASDLMVRWAKVSISDGERTVVLTGGVDYSVFPPYSYRTFAMQGQEGKTYTVSVDDESGCARATSRILPAPRIDSVDVTPLTDTTYTATVRYTAPETPGICHYMTFVRVRNRETRHYPAFLGTATTGTPGEQGQIALYPGKHASLDVGYSPHFNAGDTVDVILAHVEPVVYDYWEGYNNQVYFRDNIFVSTSTVSRGNVEGGYGVFSARGTAREVVVIGGKKGEDGSKNIGGTK